MKIDLRGPIKVMKILLEDHQVEALRQLLVEEESVRDALASRLEALGRVDEENSESSIDDIVGSLEDAEED